MAGAPRPSGGVWISTEQVFTELRQVHNAVLAMGAAVEGMRIDLTAAETRLRAVETTNRSTMPPSALTRSLGMLGWAAAALGTGWAAYKGGG